MQESGGPGVSLAIVKEGRLVFARGYGWSRVESRQPVTPSTLFRANSVSKWITHAAAHELDPGRRVIGAGFSSLQSGSLTRCLLSRTLG